VIHQIKRNEKDYLVVHTDLIVDDNGETITVPVSVQVNITKVDPKQHYIIYKQINYLFNHIIKLKKVSAVQVSQAKPWYKFW
jgi:glucose-6-phosphate-specific signal transduction histidine kinase